MKFLITLLLLLFALSASAQKKEKLTFASLPVDSVTHLVTYTAVVPVAGVTKEQLYLRAKEWAARTFVDSKAVVRMDDKDAGTYICRGLIRMPDGGHYDMMLAIYTKDGRYKYVVDQITYTYRIEGIHGMSAGVTDETAERWASYGKMNARYVDGRVKDLQVLMPKLAADIQAAMAGKVGAAKSDW